MVLGLSQINGNVPPVKICAFYFIYLFFFTAGVSNVLEPHRRRVEEAKKKKKVTPLDTGIWHVIPVLVSDTCRTWTRRQKWRVRATWEISYGLLQQVLHECRRLEH